MNNLYTIDAKCHVCGKAFKARYNVAARAKVCTPKSHHCRRGTKNGRKIPCVDKCCRSQYRQGAAASAMDNAIDPRKVLMQDEFDRTMKAAKKLGGALGMGIRFLGLTGCRLGESLLARKKNLYWQSGRTSIVKVVTLKRNGRPVRSVHLANKSPHVQDLQDWVKKLDPEDLLFEVPRRTLQRAIERILAKTKKERESLAHIFRHTRASQLIAKGLDLNYVRQQLGWSSLEMAKVYTHVLDEDKVGRLLEGV